MYAGRTGSNDSRKHSEPNVRASHSLPSCDVFFSATILIEVGIWFKYGPSTRDSTKSTRWPRLAKALARVSIDLATPPPVRAGVKNKAIGRESSFAKLFVTRRSRLSPM